MKLRSGIVTAWYVAALASFAGGLYLALDFYKVDFLGGQFDVGTVMFFAGILMVVLGVVLLGEPTE